MITTQGFRPTNFARYTPVDPRLAAFDPSAVSQGFLQSLQMVQNYQKMKAFAEAEKERADTRDGRVAATNSSNNALVEKNRVELPLFGQRANLEGQEIGSTLRLLSNKEDALNSGFKLTSEQNKAQLPLVGKRAGLESEKIGSLLRLLPSQEKAQLATNAADVASAGARTQQAITTIETEPTSRIIALEQLADRYNNSKSDAERARALQLAEIDLRRTMAEENRAKASYYDRGGASKAPPSKALEAKRIVEMMEKIASLPISDGSQFREYLDDTSGTWADPDNDPVGRVYRKQYNSLLKELSSLTDAKDGLSDDDVEAIKWVKDHPDDPRSQVILEKLGLN